MVRSIDFFEPQILAEPSEPEPYESRVRTLEFLDVSDPGKETRRLEGLTIENRRETISEARAGTYSVPRKALPGDVVKSMPPSVVESDVHTYPVETGTLSPLGTRRQHTSSVLLLEPLDKRVYRIRNALPFAALTFSLHLPNTRIKRAVEAGLGFLGISDPADRQAEKDLIAYGGEMILFVDPHLWVEGAGQGRDGKKRPQGVVFQAPASVQLNIISRPQTGDGLSDRAIVPGYQTALTFNHPAAATRRYYVDDIDAQANIETRVTHVLPIGRNEDPALIRIPWRIELDVTHDGEWIIDKETQKPRWVSTGTYSWITRMWIGPAHVTA